MARLGAVVEEEEGGKAPVLGFGELVVERGRSRLGRVEEVGVTMACDEGVRRKDDGSRGEAMVDMVTPVEGGLFFSIFFPFPFPFRLALAIEKWQNYVS